MALNIRFLQKQGVDEPVAVSGVGLNTIAGAFGHITLIGIFIVWAGRDAFGSFELPDPRYFLIGIAIVAGITVIGFLIPSVRAIVLRKLRPILQRAFDGVTDVLRRPGKVAALIGGSTLVTLAYLSTLYFSVEAFGGGLPFATVGAVYLVGSAVATAAPTPGRARRRRSRTHRWTRRGRTRQHGRGTRGVHVPALHVLGADRSRLVLLPMAPAQRVHLTSRGPVWHDRPLSELDRTRRQVDP